MIALHHASIAFAFAFAFAFALALALAATGCASAAASSNPDANCGPAPDFTSNAPPTASAGDVEPILAKNCALGGCHESAPGAAKLVLAVGSSSWADALVGVPSRENPSMNLVTAGDPEKSWLAHKVFGALCGYACDPHLGCGAQMPFGSALDAADRSTIVAWIASGAPHD